MDTAAKIPPEPDRGLDIEDNWQVEVLSGEGNFE